jgi:hypothetical protein
VIIAAESFVGRRLRTRKVDEVCLAKSTARRAIEQSDWFIDVEHGGTVCNSYGYKADTECALAVSNPFGVVVYWTGRCSANKATYRKAADVCFPGAGDLFDERVKDEDRKQNVRNLLMAAHEEHAPAMLVIAVAASI